MDLFSLTLTNILALLRGGGVDRPLLMRHCFVVYITFSWLLCTDYTVCNDIDACRKIVAAFVDGRLWHRFIYDAFRQCSRNTCLY